MDIIPAWRLEIKTLQQKKIQEAFDPGLEICYNPIQDLMIPG
jgi:hypothetical protein